MAQDAGHPPIIGTDGYNLEVVENFTYLGSTISNSLSIDVGQQQNCQGNSSYGQTKPESLEQLQPHWENQDTRLSGLYGSESSSHLREAWE